MADEPQPDKSETDIKRMSSVSNKEDNTEVARMSRMSTMSRMSASTNPETRDSKARISVISHRKSSTRERTGSRKSSGGLALKSSKDPKALPIIPPINNYTINLLSLTDEEELILKKVLDKDEYFMHHLDARIRILRKEILTLRQEGFAQPVNARRTCIRCKRQFGIWRDIVPLIDKGIPCQRCRFRVCRDCRHKQANGLWMCILCVRYREIQILTGSWVDMGTTYLTGTEVMRLSFKDADYYRFKMLERLKKKSKKKKQAVEEEQLKKKKKKKKEKKKEKKKKKKKRRKSKSKKGKGKKKKKGDKKDKKKKNKKDGKGKETKSKHKSKKKGKDKGKDKKQKSKDKKSKKDKGGKKHKSKHGKKDKKKKGKDKSKNAHKRHKDINISYSHGTELGKEEPCENKVDDSEVNAFAPELGLLPQKTSRDRSRRRVRPCDQHLRWQDESADTPLLRRSECSAQGDSNIRDVSGQSILLGKKNKCRKHRKSASLDTTVMSRGDQTSEMVRKVRKHRHSDTQHREKSKHNTHKTRRRHHAKFSSDYTLNENKDSRNLQNSEMLTDERDLFLARMVQCVVSDIHLLQTDYNCEELFCKKRVSINNCRAEDFPMRSHNLTDTGHCLRVRSEHCYKIHNNLDCHTQAVTFKQHGSNFPDETYTLNTEAPDDEWEKQCCEHDDSTVNKRNESCMSVLELNGLAEKLIVENDQSIAAITICSTTHDSQVSQDTTTENIAQLSYDKSADVSAGESHQVDPTPVLSAETKCIMSGPNDSELPSAEDHQTERHAGGKKTVSSLQSSSILKRMTSLFANILDYNASAVRIKKVSKVRDRSENYQVHKIAQYKESQAPTPLVTRESLEMEHLLQASGYLPHEKPKVEYYDKPEEDKKKNKFNLGEVLLKAKRQRLEEQQRELFQKKQQVLQRARAPQFTKESQTDFKRGLASKLCPFCKFSIEFGVP